MTIHPAKMAAPDLPTDATYADVKHEFLVRSSGYGKGLRGEASSGENSAAQEAFRNFRKGWLAGREAAPAEPVAPPKGFAFVPIEPNEGMLVDGLRAACFYDMSQSRHDLMSAYRAMLAAAPQPLRTPEAK